jgi:hypothetical protein
VIISNAGQAEKSTVERTASVPPTEAHRSGGNLHTMTDPYRGSREPKREQDDQDGKARG